MKKTLQSLWRSVRWLLVLPVVVSSGCGCGDEPLSSSIRASDKPALQAMPELNLVDLNGTSWTNKSLSDKVVLVEFWATWCGPCRDIAPDLHAFYGRTKGKLKLLSLSLDKTEREVVSHVTQHPFPNPVAHIGPQAAKIWGVNQIPALILVRKGKVVFKWEGKEAVLEALKTIETENL